MIPANEVLPSQFDVNQAVILCRDPNQGPAIMIRRCSYNHVLVWAVSLPDLGTRLLIDNWDAKSEADHKAQAIVKDNDIEKAYTLLEATSPKWRVRSNEGDG